MGRLVNGEWTTEWYHPDERGRFVRPPTKFRDRVSRDGSRGPQAEPGRFHLYVSLACPWAHRAIVARKLKRLEGNAITMSIVDPLMGDDGWRFSDRPGCVPDTVNGARFLREVYVLARPDYTGRVTTPALWDRRTGTIVNNESLEIVRMLDREFDDFADDSVRLFPDDLAGEIEAMIEANYTPINDGVYRAGFAASQEAHEEAVFDLFARLDELEALLARRRYLCGSRITAADWCLFPSLVRFDSVYAIHFKCSRRRLVDYPNLWAYTRELYQVPGVAETCNMQHIKEHYYRSHPMVNPKGLIPVGPDLDFAAPHGRDAL